MNEDFCKIIKIIPTYNETENIASLVRAIFEVSPRYSVLIVDDNSPDGTGQAVEELAKVYPNLYVYQRMNDRGFGKSYLDGFKKILSDDRYETVVMMDADFSHDPNAVPPMVEKLSDCEVIVGSRYAPGGRSENWDLNRRILSRFANYYARTILGVPVLDLTSGFMCFRKSVLTKIDLDSVRSEGYAFMIELKYRMIKAGCKICEHPIVLTERRKGQSKMSAKVIWESIWLPWKIRVDKIPV